MTYKVSGINIYASEADDDQTGQYAAHDMTGSQVIVVLRFRSMFLNLKEIKWPWTTQSFKYNSQIVFLNKKRKYI